MDFMKFTTKDNKYTVLRSGDVETDEVTLLGETYKLNEPLFNKHINGSNYDVVLPIVVKGEDGVVRGAFMCFPRFNYEAREIDKPLASYTDGKKELYTIYIKDEE